VKSVFWIVFKDTTTVNSTSNKKEKEEEYDGPSKPAKFLKEGSVLDILKSPGEIINSFYKDTAKNTLAYNGIDFLKSPPPQQQHKNPLCHS